MADERVLGVDDFTEQPLRHSYKPGEPVRTIRTYIGPQSKLAAKENSLLLSYPVLYLKSSRGVPAVIEIETNESGIGYDPAAGDGPVGIDPDAFALDNTVWTLDWEREMRDLKSHGYFDTYTGGGIDTPQVLEEIDLAIKKGIAARTNWDSYSGRIHMNDYMKLRLKGVTQCMVFVPTISANITLSKLTKFNVPAIPEQKIVSWSNVNLGCLTGGLVQTPAKGGIDQPTIHAYSGYTNTIGGIAAGSWGNAAVDEWMVCPIARTFTSNPWRYNLRFSWLGGIQWNKALYDGGSGTPP